MTIRARVYASGRVAGRSVWHYEVFDSGGNVVLYDNSCGWRINLVRALVRVEALRHMETAGHALKPYRGSRS